MARRALQKIALVFSLHSGAFFSVRFFVLTYFPSFCDGFVGSEAADEMGESLDFHERLKILTLNSL